MARIARVCAIGALALVGALLLAVAVAGIADLAQSTHAPIAKPARFGAGQQRQVFSLLDAKLVSVNVAPRPSSAADGVDITTWRTNGAFSGAMAAVFLNGTMTATVTSPSGGADGVELWGYRMSKWWLIAELRDGRTISIDVGTGYSQAVNVIGVYERLAIAGTVSAGTATAQLGPIDAWD